MHKGIILLTKATNKEEAQEKVEKFLEPLGDGNLWDWYEIGGRWTELLNPNTENFYKLTEKAGIVVNYMSEAKDKEAELQEIWKSLGETSVNPITKANGFGSEEGKDIVEAITAEKIIKEWSQDIKEEATKAWDEMIKAREKSKDGSYDMSGYYAGKFKNWDYDEINFDSNVFDIDEGTHKLPADLSDYFAVIVDIHN